MYIFTHMNKSSHAKKLVLFHVHAVIYQKPKLGSLGIESECSEQQGGR